MYILRFHLLSPQTNQNKFSFTFKYIIMELNSEDKRLLVQILVLKGRIRRRLLTKPKKKRSIWVKGIFKDRELLEITISYFKV